jgi:hypothetical protein
MLGLFRQSTAKTAATELAELLARDLPADLVRLRRAKLSVNKVTHQLEALYARAAELRDHHRLGYLGKTLLAYELQWMLKQHDYPQDFVNVVIEGLVLRLQRRDR